MPNPYTWSHPGAQACDTSSASLQLISSESEEICSFLRLLARSGTTYTARVPEEWQLWKLLSGYPLKDITRWQNSLIRAFKATIVSAMTDVIYVCGWMQDAVNNEERPSVSLRISDEDNPLSLSYELAVINLATLLAVLLYADGHLCSFPARTFAALRLIDHELNQGEGSGLDRKQREAAIYRRVCEVVARHERTALNIASILNARSRQSSWSIDTYLVNIDLSVEVPEARVEYLQDVLTFALSKLPPFLLSGQGVLL